METSLISQIIDLAKKFVRIFPRSYNLDSVLANPVLPLPRTEPKLLKHTSHNTDFATFQANLSHHQEFRW